MHPNLKATGNISAVKTETKTMLGGTAPRPQDARRILPCKNCMVFDFRQNRAYPVHRRLAVARYVPWDYESWRADGDSQAEYRACVQGMLRWEQAGNGDLIPPPLTGDVTDLLGARRWRIYSSQSRSGSRGLAS